MYTESEVLDFVKEEDVRFVRLAFFDITGRQKNISIMAKIETPLGVDRLAEISEVSDGILIGRGDLRNTSEHRYNDYLTIALKKITKLSVYKGIGTFFLTDLSQNGTISEKDEKDLEYANGLDFIMLSKEVVNSNHPYAVLNYLAERCRQ